MAPFVESEAINQEFASLQSPAAILNDMQQACSMQEALDMAREAILDNHRINMEVTDQCALNITIIWEYIQARKTSEPQNSKLIEQWTHNMTQEISETAIVEYQSLAASSRRRIARHESRIRTNWGIVPTQILPAHHFNARKSLSKECLGNLAQLSEHVSLQAGRELLLEQIRTRTISKSQGLKVTDSHLKPRDVVITLEALGVKNSAEPVSAGSSTGATTPHTPTQNSPAPHTHTRKLSPTALLPLSTPKKPKKRRRRQKPASDLEFTDEEGGGRDGSQ
ncbi:MAG: hypothetical protein L6R41_008073, partial [Letrouitia leprolyta]